MKKVLFSFFILLPAIQISSKENDAIILHLAAGSTITYMLEQEPKVSFEGEDMVIQTLNNTIVYNSTDVNKFTFTSSTGTNINTIESNTPFFSLIGNTLVAKGLVSNSAISIYTADGKKIMDATTDNHGCISIPLPNTRNTVYIVHTSIANFKIIK